MNALERTRADVCIASRRWRKSLAQDLLTRALAKDLLLNALNRLDAVEARRAGRRKRVLRWRA